jgi:uncharacterized membrane protein YhaH (DUF805 family)
MEWMFLPLVRLFDFSGRSARMEYNMFALFQFLLVFIFAIVFFGGGDPATMKETRGGFMVCVLVIGVILLLPNLALSVRRFHDFNLSGWLIFLNLIPFVHWGVTLVLMVVPGTSGRNNYGADPRDPDGEMTSYTTVFE